MVTTGDDSEPSGTMGQADADTLSGGDFELAGGFWVTFENPCPADFNCDGSVSTLDFLAFLNGINEGRGRFCSEL